MFFICKNKETYLKLFPFTLLVLFIFSQFFNTNLLLFAANDKLLWHPPSKLTVGEYLRYSNIFLTIIFALSGCLLLMLFKVTTRLRAAIMTLVFIVFAIILDYSGLKCALKMPSPLCSLTRPFLFIKSGNLDIPLKFIIALSTIGILSLIGNKLFCGWVCPIGAIQEMMNLIPFSGKRIKIPFLWMNLVRVTLFVSFIPILFVLGRVIYFNPFAPIRLGFTADFWTIYSWVFLIIIVIISFFIYRPYCYFICPIGLITWLLERISPIKIRYHKEICSECKTCITHTNCPTVESIINEKRIRPDCHSCGKCIEVCPNNALKFNFK